MLLLRKGRGDGWSGGLRPAAGWQVRALEEAETLRCLCWAAPCWLAPHACTTRKRQHLLQYSFWSCFLPPGMFWHRYLDTVVLSLKCAEHNHLLP